MSGDHCRPVPRPAVDPWSLASFNPVTCELVYTATDGRVRGIHLPGCRLPPASQAAELLAKVRSGALDAGVMHRDFAMAPATRAAAERALERAIAAARLH